MEYKKVKLNDIVSILGDGIHGTPKYSENGEYYFINGNNLSEGKIIIKQDTKRVSLEEYEKYKKELNNRTLLVSINGTLGNVAVYNNEKCILGKSACYFNVRENVNKQFIKYILYSNEFQKYIQEYATGTTIKNMSLKAMREYEFKLPEIDIQNKIANILSNIDKKIELNNQINDNLLKMCNTIYHNYLDKYSELIENKKIVEIASRVVTGKTPSTKNEEFWNGDIPFITIPDMHNQVFTINTERKISNIGAKVLIPKNSISVSCIATVGLVSISTEESQTNQQINSIVLNNDYDLYYLFEFVSEQENFMKNIAGGSTTYNINKNTFENIEVPYLPTDKLIEFHNIVSKMFEKIKLNQLENKNLEQLRDTLLPKLMNGEIDLDKIEI